MKSVGPLVIYKIVDPHNYLLMIPDGKILQGLFEHERLKLLTTRTGHSKINSSVQLKKVLTRYGYIGKENLLPETTIKNRN